MLFWAVYILDDCGLEFLDCSPVTNSEILFSRVDQGCTCTLRFVTCLLVQSPDCITYHFQTPSFWCEFVRKYPQLFQYPLPCHSLIWGPKMTPCSVSFCAANCRIVGCIWNTGPGALNSLFCCTCTHECIAGWPFTLTWCYGKGAGYF